MQRRSTWLSKEHTSVQLHVQVLGAMCLVEVVPTAAVVCPSCALTYFTYLFIYLLETGSHSSVGWLETYYIVQAGLIDLAARVLGFQG